MTLSVDEVSFTKINGIPDEEVLRMVTVLLDNLIALVRKIQVIQHFDTIVTDSRQGIVR